MTIRQTTSQSSGILKTDRTIGNEKIDTAWVIRIFKTGIFFD